MIICFNFKSEGYNLKKISVVVFKAAFKKKKKVEAF